MSKLSVAVIQGGPSSEAEVSRASAKSVCAALVEAGHAAVRLELDAFLAETLRTGGYEVAFPVVHGAVGEDGSLQGLLEVLELPYVGSDVLASALAMAKPVARVMFATHGLPIAKGLAAQKGEASAASVASRARKEIGARLVVKPAANGSAIGVARIEADATDADVARAIEAAWDVDDAALIEHYAKGKEVTCGVLDVPMHVAGTASVAGFRAGPMAFPPTEIQAPNDAFYSYEARYAPGRSVHACPAPFSDAVTKRVQSVAEEAHRTLGCRDLSRADFVVGDVDDPDRVTLLEVNTMPGFTETSLYPEAAKVIGLALPTLASIFISVAHARGPRRRNTPRALPK